MTDTPSSLTFLPFSPFRTLAMPLFTFTSPSITPAPGHLLSLLSVAVYLLLPINLASTFFFTISTTLIMNFIYGTFPPTDRSD